MALPQTFIRVTVVVALIFMLSSTVTADTRLEARGGSDLSMSRLTKSNSALP